MNVLVQNDEVGNVIKGQMPSFVPGQVSWHLVQQLNRWSPAVGRNDRDDLSTGVISEPACFAQVDMGAMITENGIGRLFEVRAYGQLVGHCTRRDEQGGSLPTQSCDVCFEGNSIRLMIDVVAKGGLDSVLVHLLRGN